MQLIPLDKGRFQQLWQKEYDLIEQVVINCITKVKVLSEGDHVMRQGDELSALFLVKKGRISIGYEAHNGRGFQLGTMDCDHQIFGEMEFFSQYPCQLNIIAEEGLEVSVINSDKLHQALVDNPQLALFFASAIAIDYQDTVEIFTRRMLHPISYNVAHDLYHTYLNDQPVEGFTKAYLEAERFATTDRVYRRAVKNLEDLGLIKREKDGIHICDLKALKAYLETKPS